MEFKDRSKELREESGLAQLGEALPLEIARVQRIVAVYEEIPMGFIAATMMKSDIEKARKAMLEQDIAMMMAAYQDLKEYDY